MRTDTSYDEEYSTCSYAHAWLRIMSEDLNPDEVTEFLGVTPSQIQRVGEPRTNKTTRVNKTSGWFLSTKGVLSSLDARHHLDWLLDHVANKKAEIDALRKRQYLVDVCVRWDSKSGHGGPTLSPKQLLGFGNLGIEVWFDVYFDFDDFDDEE